jgi:hypothetical protein
MDWITCVSLGEWVCIVPKHHVYATATFIAGFWVGGWGTSKHRPSSDFKVNRVDSLDVGDLVPSPCIEEEYFHRDGYRCGILDCGP